MPIIRGKMVSNNLFFIKLCHLMFELFPKYAQTDFSSSYQENKFCKWKTVNFASFCFTPTQQCVLTYIVFIICSLVCSTSFPFTEENCFYFYKTPEKNTHPCYLLLNESRSLLSGNSDLLNCSWPQ